MDILFSELASQLNVGVDFLKANGEGYILEYAKYAMVSKIGFYLILGIMLLLITGTVTIFSFQIIYWDDLMYVPRTVGGLAIILNVVIPLIPLAVEIISYRVSPLMYGLKALIN